MRLFNLNGGIILSIFNLAGKIPIESDWFKIEVIDDDMRYFHSYCWYIIMTTTVFWVNFIDNEKCYFCSKKLKWKENAIFRWRMFYSFVFVLRNIRRECWTNVLKERVEVVCNTLHIVYFVSMNYKIRREIFLCCYIWAIRSCWWKFIYIFNTYLWNFVS